MRATHDVGRLNVINRQDCCQSVLMVLPSTSVIPPVIITADYTLVGTLTGTTESQTFSSASGLSANVRTNDVSINSTTTLAADGKATDSDGTSEDQQLRTSGGGAIVGAELTCCYLCF